MQKAKQRYLQFPNKLKHDAGESVAAKSGQVGVLTVRSLTLIGVGGIIGAGFFLASGMPIVQAGPAILLSYLIGALIMSQVLGSITSISVNHPVHGSFRVYSEEMLGTYIGFLQGWVFFVSGVLAVTSEAVAMSIFTKLWLPYVPLSLLATLYVLLIIALNAFGVQNFEKVESVMSIVKIAALVGFMLVGILMVLGVLQAGHATDLRFFTQGQGFFPNGWSGVGKSMLIVIFSYSGIGVIANAVSEVKDPKQTIPKATTGLIVLITILYLAATAFLLFMIPWNHVSTSQSPYVEALNRVHLHVLGTILNAIILISAFSVMAGTLFSNMIMLKSLAQANKAPQFLLRKSKHGRSWGTLVFCTVALFAALPLAYVLPSKVYNYLTSASAFFTFFNWTIMTLTFLRWLKYGNQSGDRLSVWAFARPYGQWATILVILILAIFSLFDADQRVGFYYALGVFIVVSLGYVWNQKRGQAR